MALSTTATAEDFDRTVEHGDVKDLVAQLEGVEPDGEMYDAKVKVLSECVKHHVKGEQSELFAKAKASSLDMVELGARMAARKDDLLAQAAWNFKVSHHE